MSSIVKSETFGNDIQSSWLKLTRSLPLSRIHSKKQYKVVVKAMEFLADMVNDDEKHPLVGLLEVLEVLVEALVAALVTGLHIDAPPPVMGHKHQSGMTAVHSRAEMRPGRGWSSDENGGEGGGAQAGHGGGSCPWNRAGRRGVIYFSKL